VEAIAIDGIWDVAADTIVDAHGDGDALWHAATDGNATSPKRAKSSQDRHDATRINAPDGAPTINAQDANKRYQK
jgi:hypothetical protein